MSSSPLSPATVTLSSESQSRPLSTQPSSPPSGSPTDMSDKLDQEPEEEHPDAMNKSDDEDDDMEDMDGKAKALTNLLKTSSVSSVFALYR